MKLLYFDCVGGIAGDMALAALLDAGAAQSAVRGAIAAVGIEPERLGVEQGMVHGLRGLRVHVDDGHAHDHGHGEGHAHDHAHGEGHAHDHGHGHAHWADIRERLRGARLRDRTRERALAIFERIAVAEAQIHGVNVGDVAFHEVGAIDSIVDVVGVAAALDDLGVERITCSPLPMGRGVGRSGHGPIPLPAPAALLVCEAAGIPVYGVEPPGETVTPTGAAIAALATSFGPMPPMRPVRTGYGLGTREVAARPNLVRAVVGEEAAPAAEGDELLLSANVDDMAPALAEHLLDALFAAGALDVWFTPILMKKSRPAFEVSALVPAAARAAAAAVLFRESTSIGLRAVAVAREKLDRRIETVDTPYGAIAVKVSSRDGAVLTASPEYEDCRRAAVQHDAPLRDVFRAAVRAWEDGAAAGAKK